ncbi:MAG: hypothetical protein PHI94_04775 [Eubacteriaceae bacterium]|nr:hypothetical protein [Eubacteriaceae bacterium]
MVPWKKYLLLAITLVFIALLMPTIIALLGVVLSPIITTVGFIALIFIITVVIAYKNKIGRK